MYKVARNLPPIEFTQLCETPFNWTCLVGQKAPLEFAVDAGDFLDIGMHEGRNGRHDGGSRMRRE
jgi:hypothetical protein